jgi:hypothetical protein
LAPLGFCAGFAAAGVQHEPEWKSSLYHNKYLILLYFIVFWRVFSESEPAGMLRMFVAMQNEVE